MHLLVFLSFYSYAAVHLFVIGAILILHDNDNTRNGVLRRDFRLKLRTQIHVSTGRVHGPWTSVYGA